jgi:hypothetical protein
MQRGQLYKYFAELKWAEAFLDGSMLFRSLSYFRDLEDKNVREDEKEGVSVFQPEGGLIIHNETQGTTLTLPGDGLETVVKQDEIFVFCVSRSLTDERRERFKAVACVEISNIGAFCDRVTAALPSNAKFPGLPGRQRIGQRVEYYCESGDCNPRWALPDVIATSKRETYAWQDEFRLVFRPQRCSGFRKNRWAYSLAGQYTTAAKTRRASSVWGNNAKPARYLSATRLHHTRSQSHNRRLSKRSVKRRAIDAQPRGQTSQESSLHSGISLS